ncbi:interleukin-1 receptor type 2-like [Pungitius pungitius]|uniref:interleukin-1 receptor type 2-like n=1 Tax=Pungitius pungitius TaxID=134920 RepID=UPI002E163A33
MEVLVLLGFLLAALLLPPAGGAATREAPPTADGCYLASPEVNLLRKEGEPVVLSFPFFESELERLHVAPPGARCLITGGNGTEGGTYQGEGRVQQRQNQLWFLPARAEDSGEYLCTYRNASCCVRASIRLQVHRNRSVESFFPVPAVVGEHLRLPCPSTKDFLNTQGLVKWHKDSAPLRSGRAGNFLQDGGRLLIPAVRRAHGGVYTCRRRVLIDQRPFEVTRTVVLTVEGVDPVTTSTSTTSTSTSSTSTSTSSTSSSTSSSTPPTTSTSSSTPPTTSGSSTSSSSSSLHMVGPPVILSPQNGTVFESVHGSALLLSCTVLTDCRATEETAVTWLVNKRPVESSYLEGRAQQLGRRVTAAPDGCRIELRLVVVAMTEEDVQAELRCVAQNPGGRQEVVSRLQLEDPTFTWLVVSAVAVSCFLTVVSVFLFVLLRPPGKRNMDYFLARQSSF